MTDQPSTLSRRAFIGSATCLMAAGAMRAPFAIAGMSKIHELVAKNGKASLLGGESEPTDIWGYNGVAPGPILRVRQGDDLHVRLKNDLKQPTTLHWHGIRINNAMDGVPGLTQRAVEPGETFDYRFACPDAGTFWYHPHKHSSEQVARGLHGMLVVEEREPPKVDQDRVLVLDDWRLDNNGQIHAASFGAIHDRAHGGRFGNTITCNGSTKYSMAVTAGERVRLRFCNVANASSFAVQIAGHDTRIIAIDGQPVMPFNANNGIIFLSPGQRVDAIVDMVAKVGSRHKLKLLGFEQEHSIGSIDYSDAKPIRPRPLDTSITLPVNPLETKLDLPNAVDVTLMMEGGAMGGMRGAKVSGEYVDMRQLVREHGYVWAFNGSAGMPKEPIARVKRGQTVRLQLVNETSWPHAIHIHGHHFKQIDGGNGDGYGDVWRDTVLLRRGQTITTAFVADNPGKWMLHCHMLEHQAGGMATWFEVLA